ncbi:hypothetical protein [Enhygromyxa salina]|nr:hypothetical protein [Enhygromyxa salina]
MREVTFCERSTITEAWALVLGRPVPVIPEEPAAIALTAKRTLRESGPGRELHREPALIVAEIPREGPVAPFWSQQWSWDSGQLRARVGHRYLSVHRFADETHRYETYERSLEPALAPWLDACSQTYDDALIMPAFEQVAYGYINTFRFASTNFDLSQAFHLNLGVQLEGQHDGLDGVDIKLYYRDKGRMDAQVMVQIAARQGPDADESLLVQTKTSATITVNNGFWKDHGRIKREVLAAKTIAKRAFFELATERTHLEMGAQYDDSP